MRTHIEHFIDSNPLLASTSCTDPVNNLKHPPKQTISKTPRITLNLTENNQQQTRIRSRSPSPFWVKGETSTYSEVVKMGCISRNNSRSTSPHSKPVEERISRKSSFNFLRTPIMRARSKSPKDKKKPEDSGKDIKSNTIVSPSKASTSSSKENKNNLDIVESNSKKSKRRSRSRRNRKAKNNSENKSITNNESTETITPENILDNKNIDTSMSKKPEIVISNEKNQHDCNTNLKLQNIPSPVTIVETFTQNNELGDDLYVISNQELLTVDTTAQISTVDNFSKPQLPLANVSGTEYSNSCFDLNEQLKGIFGSVDQKHYRHRVFDRPRSKSDTRDLNKLTQIFTSPSTNNEYMCRFERSAESVKNNFNRDSISGRRSFDNILSPFGNTQTQRLDGTGNENNKAVRLSVEI